MITHDAQLALDPFRELSITSPWLATNLFSASRPSEMIPVLQFKKRNNPQTLIIPTYQLLEPDILTGWAQGPNSRRTKQPREDARFPQCGVIEHHPSGGDPECTISLVTLNILQVTQ
jgi:hypothetical protein